MRAIISPELVENGRDVELDGPFRYGKGLPNLSIGEAGGHQAQHAPFARAQQACPAARLGDVLDELRRNPRTEVRLACVNLPNRLRDLRPGDPLSR